MRSRVHHIELLQRKVLERGANGFCRYELVLKLELETQRSPLVQQRMQQPGSPAARLFP